MKEKKNKTVFMTSSGGSRVSHDMHAGDPDSGFVLPATELCREEDREGSEVTLRGAKASFELCVSRSCSVRMLAVVLGPPKNIFRVTSTAFGVEGSLNGGFGSLEDTSSMVGRFLEGCKEDVFSDDDDRPFFFRSLAKRTKGKVVLDQVQNLRVGDTFQFRPVNGWVDLQGKVKYNAGTVDDVHPADGICTRGVDEKPASLYFIVLFHVPGRGPRLRGPPERRVARARYLRGCTNLVLYGGCPPPIL